MPPYRTITSNEEPKNFFSKPKVETKISANKKAKRLIYNMTRKLNEGEVYLGRVTRIIQIGAFVEVLPGKEGMIHISQLAEGRVGKVEDEVAVGDEVLVKVREIDSKGRLNLTRLGIHPEEAAAARKAATVV